ncbi:hypothetical protein [Streptomyces sp. NPDC093589]|uniref:hypothetical protein n=1 Tax=Streptomyces sp. NPDC093589 TaxID=3366043 RepID=UPI003825CFE9
MITILSALGVALLATALVAAKRLPRHSVTAVMAAGAGAILASNILRDDQFWAGVAGLGVVLLVGATVSYYREARKAGDVR